MTRTYGLRHGRWLGVVAVVATVMAAWTAVQAELEPPLEHWLTLAVTALVRNEHLTGHALDNEIAELA